MPAKLRGRAGSSAIGGGLKADSSTKVTRVLHLSAYRRLLAAYTLNELAYSIGSLALAVLVYRRTGSAIGAAGYFLSAMFAPALVSPWFVARLDGRTPRRVLPALYALEALAFAALAWVASRFALAPVLALALVDGVIAVTARSLARAASAAVTSEAGVLREGNAILNASFSVCFMVGPALGGVVVALGGTVAALLANSVIFALIALTLLTATALPGASPDRVPAAGRVRAALAYARSQRQIRLLLGLQVFALVAFTVAVPVEVVLAEHTLHAGVGGYGALLSAWGAGAVAGSAIYARFRKAPGRQLIALGSALLGFGYALMAAAPSLALAIVGAVIGGAGNGIAAVAERTTLQELVQAHWMALMMSLNESIFQAAPGVGILLGGVLAELAGARVAFAVGAGGALAITVLAWVLLSSVSATGPSPRAERGPPLTA